MTVTQSRFPVRYSGIYLGGKNDSMDYLGVRDEIAFVGSEGRGVSIHVAGDVMFSVGSDSYLNVDPSCIGLTGAKMSRRNWFELFRVKNKRILDRYGLIALGLNEAIMLAKEVLLFSCF
jgi:hypothetical protein